MFKEAFFTMLGVMVVLIAGCGGYVSTSWMAVPWIEPAEHNCSLSGRVVIEESNEVLGGSAVVLKSVTGNVFRETRARRDGSYLFTNIPSGVYYIYVVKKNALYGDEKAVSLRAGTNMHVQKSLCFKKRFFR